MLRAGRPTKPDLVTSCIVCIQVNYSAGATNRIELPLPVLAEVEVDCACDAALRWHLWRRCRIVTGIAWNVSRPAGATYFRAISPSLDEAARYPEGVSSPGAMTAGSCLPRVDDLSTSRRPSCGLVAIAPFDGGLSVVLGCAPGEDLPPSTRRSHGP